MADGVNVSKAIVQAVTGPEEGTDVAKTVAYAVTFPLEPGVNIAKTVMYAVTAAAPGTMLQFMARFM